MSNDNHKEQLSCLMDGELGRSEGGFLLRRLTRDRELQGFWARYHLCRDVLRKQRVRSTGDLVERVSAALAEQPTPRRASVPRWVRPVAGVAVAATVAVAVFNSLYLEPTVTAPAEAAAVPTKRAFEGAPTLPQRATVAAGPIRGNDASIDPRLQAYVLRHNQASVRRGQGLVPYIYMVSTPENAETADDASGDGSVVE